MLKKLKLELEKQILKKTNYQIKVVDSRIKDSDLSISLFKLMKETYTDMEILYKEIATSIKDNKYVKATNLLSGFLNISLNKALFNRLVLDTIISLEDNFAKKEPLNKTIVIDYSAPNIAKSFSVGHLRSTVIGNALKNIYQNEGYKVVGINYLGDWGTQFGNLIAGYNLYANEYDLKNNEIDSIKDIYVRFHKEAETNPELLDLGRKEFLKLEQNDATNIKLWQHFRAISIKEFEKTYERLNVSFDLYSGESEYNDKISAVINDLKEKKLLSLDNNCQVVFLKNNLPPALITKQDGTSLYLTRDLACLKDRDEKYHFEKALYVVGGEQKLHFEQLKQVAEMLGYNHNFQHISFGLVLQNGKKMSTRKGTGKKLDEVIDDAFNKAKQEILEKNPNLANIDEVANKIATSALIFFNLKNDRILNIDFNLDDMLKFEGQTGPYLQYSIVRIKSILKKVLTTKNNKLDETLLAKDIYNDIILTLARFSEITTEACLNNAPSLISKYLLNLAQLFNKFYAQEKIISDDKLVLNTNIYLIKAIMLVLTKGLSLLGLSVLEEM